MEQGWFFPAGLVIRARATVDNSTRSFPAARSWLPGQRWLAWIGKRAGKRAGFMRGDWAAAAAGGAAVAGKGRHCLRERRTQSHYASDT